MPNNWSVSMIFAARQFQYSFDLGTLQISKRLDAELAPDLSCFPRPSGLGFSLALLTVAVLSGTARAHISVGSCGTHA
jgi:hypothetical protein